MNRAFSACVGPDRRPNFFCRCDRSGCDCDGGASFKAAALLSARQQGPQAYGVRMTRSHRDSSSEGVDGPDVEGAVDAAELEASEEDEETSVEKARAERSTPQLHRVTRSAFWASILE